MALIARLLRLPEGNAAIEASRDSQKQNETTSNRYEEIVNGILRHDYRAASAGVTKKRAGEIQMFESDH
jgi:hypothetical protein